MTTIYWRWINSRPFAPFLASFVGIQKHNLLLRMRFSELRLQFVLQQWIHGPGLPLGHSDYTVPITQKLPFELFLPVFGQKTRRLLGANSIQFRLLPRFRSGFLCFGNSYILQMALNKCKTRTFLLFFFFNNHSGAIFIQKFSRPMLNFS